MTQLALKIALIFVIYIIGYAVGRHDVVEDAKEMEEEVKKRNKEK